MQAASHAFASPTDRAWRSHNIARAEQANADQLALAFGRTDAGCVQSVGIVGAGLMGSAIAAASAAGGFKVVLADADAEVLQTVGDRIAAKLAQQDGLTDAQARRFAAEQVEPTAEIARVAGCDIVLESIVEDQATKQQLYAQLEPHLAEGTILASNSSGIPIEWLAEGMADRGRFCGLHFLHPIRNPRLVEVVRGPQTTEQTLQLAVGYVEALGKIPCVVEDGPGFLVNRLLAPYYNAGLELLADGVETAAVEWAAQQFGMDLGPIRLLDEAGLDTAMQCGGVLRDAFAGRLTPSPLLATLVKWERLGRKAGRGFFTYSDTSEQAEVTGPDEDVRRAIDYWVREVKPAGPETITAHLILPMLLEATRILEEGKVRDPWVIDLASVYGVGFPIARGGLFSWADEVGAANLLAMLAPFEAVGERFQPTETLLRLASTGGRFHDPADGGAPGRRKPR